jgi:hypothetical protein
MKTGKLALAAAAIFALGTIPSSADAQGPAPATRSEQTGASLAGGTRISAELNSSLDSKKAKPGDAVTAHTTEAVKSADDRTILPKGTKLVGHITQASARSKGDSESALGIGFDKAILKGGEEVPLNATIQALAAPASNAPGLMPGPSMPTTSPSGGTNNPGMPGNRGSQPNPGSYPPGSYPRTDGGGSYPNAGAETNSAGELPPNSRGVYGLEGLQLSMAPSNSTQVSLISSNGKNVHLDGGTRMLLVTPTLASGAPGR